MSAARSEHEVSEIIDGLSEQEVRLALPFSSSLPPTLLLSRKARRSSTRPHGEIRCQTPPAPGWAGFPTSWWPVGRS